MDVSTPPPIQPSYKDRRTGLIVFGVFAILIGAFCALLVPLAIFGQVMTARRLGTDFDASAAIIGAFVYGVMAVVMIWLGVGSVLARRWARALLLCLGWIGLIIGLIAMPAVFVAMNSIGDAMRAQGQVVPAATLAVIKFVALATTFVIYIVIPGVAVLFYRSPHVKHTCEVRDPVVRWTDRCPLPVLALVLMKGFGALVVLLILPIYGHAFPVYGTVVLGWESRFLWVAVIVFMAYAARGFYRLDLRVWRIYLVGAMVLWASSLVTFQRIGLVEFYRQMGLPERQLLMMEKNPLLQGNSLLWISLLSMVVFLGYLLYVRRYFTAATDRPAAA
jgi:MFS family permease